MAKIYWQSRRSLNGNCERFRGMRSGTCPLVQLSRSRSHLLLLLLHGAWSSYEDCIEPKELFTLFNFLFASVTTDHDDYNGGILPPKLCARPPMKYSRLSVVSANWPRKKWRITPQTVRETNNFTLFCKIEFARIMIAAK